MENLDIAGLIAQLGFAAIFLWLFWVERKAHEKTRETYMNDLRTIAGLQQQLGFTNAVVSETKHRLTTQQEQLD